MVGSVILNFFRKECLVEFMVLTDRFVVAAISFDVMFISIKAQSLTSMFVRLG